MIDAIEPSGLMVPNSEHQLRSGCIVRLGRFSTTEWIVRFGWYTWAGNRPVCGWYLIDSQDSSCIKPLQLPDLDDIYMIRSVSR